MALAPATERPMAKPAILCSQRGALNSLSFCRVRGLWDKLEVGIPDLCGGEGGVEDVLGLEGGGGPQALRVQEGERPFEGSCCHFVYQLSKTAESARSECI